MQISYSVKEGFIMSVLFIDTDGELRFDLADEITTNVIRMPYTLNGTEYFDDGGREINYLDFFKALREGGTSSTAALNSTDYIRYFEPYFAKGEEILYISFGSNFSGTFSFMETAIKELSEKYPAAKFTRFDTGSISMGCGYMQYYGGKKFIENGGNVEETVKYLEQLKYNVFTMFVVDDLNHLKKGGRISPATAVIGSILGIKPVLKITDECKIEKVDTVKGSKKVISYLLEQFRQHHDDCENYDVWILQADKEADAEVLKKSVLEIEPNANVHIQLVGPVIGTHCGPGTLSIIFHSPTR